MRSVLGVAGGKPELGAAGWADGPGACRARFHPRRRAARSWLRPGPSRHRPACRSPPPAGRTGRWRRGPAPGTARQNRPAGWGASVGAAHDRPAWPALPRGGGGARRRGAELAPVLRQVGNRQPQGLSNGKGAVQGLRAPWAWIRPWGNAGCVCGERGGVRAWACRAAVAWWAWAPWAGARAGPQARARPPPSAGSARTNHRAAPRARRRARSEGRLLRKRPPAPMPTFPAAVSGGEGSEDRMASSCCGPATAASRRFVSPSPVLVVALARTGGRFAHGLVADRSP
jgi:hypothetical protein